jgi:hypothetical protein
MLNWGTRICGTITVAVGPMLDGGHRLSGCDGLQLKLLSPIHEILKNMNLTILILIFGQKSSLNCT